MDFLAGIDLLGDIVKETNLVPELVAHPSSVVARDVEPLEAEEELEVVVDLLGMPGGQQMILIESPVPRFNNLG